MRRIVWASLIAVLFVSVACASDGDLSAETPSSATSTDVRIIDDCPELPCQGPLEPGAYRWTISDPTIDFEISTPGWTWLFGGGGLHLIADATPPPRHEGLYVADGIYLLHDPTIASQDCEESSEPGVGGSVSDLVAWLETAPGLSVSEPTPVTVGGFDGMQLDIEIDPEWERTCFFSEGLPAVPLVFNGAAPLGGYHWALFPDQSLRWFILDSEPGVVIIDLEDGPGGDLRHDELFRIGGAIVDSFAFSSS